MQIKGTLTNESFILYWGQSNLWTLDPKHYLLSFNESINSLLQPRLYLTRWYPVMGWCTKFIHSMSKETYRTAAIFAIFTELCSVARRVQPWLIYAMCIRATVPSNTKSSFVVWARNWAVAMFYRISSAGIFCIMSKWTTPPVMRASLHAL